VPFASWGSRVGALLLDKLIAAVVMIPFLLIGVILVSGRPDDSGIGVLIMVLGVVAGVAVYFWNRVARQGKTGQSLGKQALGLRLVSESTGQPIGFGKAFGRGLVNVCLSVIGGLFLFGIPLLLSYLWPLWDDKKQTWADKVVGSIVIHT